MKKITKKITLEDLAGMVNNGFRCVDERFGKIDQRFDKLESSINMRFFEVHDQLGGLQNQMGNLEKLYERDNNEHKVFRTKIEHLEKAK
jgi:hypothetical protein